jgi:hypothetical protein
MEYSLKYEVQVKKTDFPFINIKEIEKNTRRGREEFPENF